MFQCADSSDNITVKLSDKLSVRLYRDNQPHCLETARLQKGLVLVFNGVELIEEGLGFGVPVAKYQDKTFFSSSAQTKISRSGKSTIFEKDFFLDTISRKRFLKTYVNDYVYSFFHRIFEKGYLANKALTPFYNKIMEYRDKSGVKTIFQKVAPRGSVKTRYSFSSDRITVKMDFSNLEFKNCQQILVLNEQGATTFERYYDTDKLELVGRRIGAWDQINAQQASLRNASGSLFFTLQNRAEASIFRGWEKTRNRFSWAGLSYALSGKKKVFSYTIQVKENI